MIEMGLIVGIGLLVTLFKCNWKWRMRIISNPLWMDAGVLVFLMVLHWGTFSGGMVATIGALTCSLVLSAARWLVGFMDKGKYVPGVLNVSHKF